MKNNSHMTKKIASANVVLAFTMMFFLITMFFASNTLSSSFAAISTHNGVPETLNYKGSQVNWDFMEQDIEDDLELVLGFNFKAGEVNPDYDMYCIEGQVGISGNGSYTNPTKISDGYSTGLAWLLENSYPKNSNSRYMNSFSTPEEKKYVTQFAIWYYLDLVGATYNLDGVQSTNLTQVQVQRINEIASGNTAGSIYAKKVLELANAAKAYNDANKGADSISIDANNIQFTVSGDNLVSNEIGVKVNKDDLFKNYTASVANNEFGAKIIDVNNTSNETLTFGKGATFKVVVPIANIKDKDNFNLNINVVGNFSSIVYQYDAVSDNGVSEQRPIIVADLTTPANITVNIPLTVITKTDITNGKPVSGATLVVSDSNNSEVTRFVTDGNPHYFRLNPGNYTLTEITSPDGYELNTESVPFTVKNDGTITKVEMKNTPTTTVPNTASSIPAYLYVVGALIIIIGAVVIYFTVNPKKNNK